MSYDQGFTNFLAIVICWHKSPLWEVSVFSLAMDGDGFLPHILVRLAEFLYEIVLIWLCVLPFYFAYHDYSFICISVTHELHFWKVSSLHRKLDGKLCMIK